MKIKTAPIILLIISVAFNAYANEWTVPEQLTFVGPNQNRSYDASEPAIAFNALEDTYLLVWEGNDVVVGMADEEVEVFAQLFNTEGSINNQGPVRVSYMGPAMSVNYDGRKPEVVFNPDMNEFLVVWYGDHHLNGLVEGELEIFAQRVDGASGLLIGEMKRISDSGPNGNRSFDALNPHVSYNSTNHTYLVIWHAEEGDAASPLGSFEIYGQLLDGDLNELGVNDFRISDMGPNNSADYNAFSPVATYNNIDNEYLVTWYGDDDRDGRVSGEFEIYAQRISGSNAALLSNDSISVSQVGINGDIDRSAQYPDVSFNSDLNEYLIVWSADDSKGGRVGNEFEIYAQVLTHLGVEKGSNDFLISEMGTDGDNNFDAFRPKTTYQKSTEQYIVAWRADDHVDGEFEIYAQRLDGESMLRLGKTSEKLSSAGVDDSLLYDARRVAMAINPSNNDLTVVWEQEDQSATQVEGEFEIFSSHLNSTNIWIDNSISGSWFDPNRNGEGYILEVLEGNRALMMWFTYLPNIADQAWVIGTGKVKHNRVILDDVNITSGGVFGPTFDPNSVQINQWGEIAFEFSGCNTGTINFNSELSEYGHGNYSVDRVTSLSGANCDTNEQVVDPFNSLSGAWFDPSHDGEGWILEYLGNQRILMYWFTYDDSGDQKWLLSVGNINQNVISFDQVNSANGTFFGDSFNPDDVSLLPWGEITMTIEDCNHLIVDYSSEVPLFGQGQLLAQTLTNIDGLNCEF